MDYVISFWEIELEYLAMQIQYPVRSDGNGYEIQNDNGDGEDENSNESIEWTDPVIFLVELVYSIHGAHSVNHGRITKKKLMKAFGKVFNVDMGNGYRTYIDVTRRTGERSKYINILKDSLEKVLEEKDSR